MQAIHRMSWILFTHLKPVKHACVIYDKFTRQQKSTLKIATIGGLNLVRRVSLLCLLIRWNRDTGCGWSRDHQSIQNCREHLVQRTIKYYPVAPPFQQIFLPPRFWVVTWPAATRVSVPTTKGGRDERPWERGCGRLYVFDGNENLSKTQVVMNPVHVFHTFTRHSEWKKFVLFPSVIITYVSHNWL